MADQSKLCTITNNSGQDAVVISTVADGETTSQGAIVSFNQQLEILKTSSGNTVIKNGSSDTVTLDQAFPTDTGGTQYAFAYDLIISDSNWLCPLARLLVMQSIIGPPWFDPQTVNATDAAAMNHAFNFYQTIAAYPASELTQGYINALQAQDNGSTQSGVGNAVDAFFQGTSTYKDVTFMDVLTAEKYYNDFPCVWAEYKDSITYYLYGSNDIAVIFVGALFLNKSGTVDITKPNGGYTCLFAPAVNPSDTSKADVDTSKAVNLTYNSGDFVDDINASTPKIALRGNFQLKRVFTRNPNDVAIIPAFKGSVNGTACTGINVPMYQY